jgi:RNA polymerase sigma-70 factor (ECF subfamily)
MSFLMFFSVVSDMSDEGREFLLQLYDQYYSLARKIIFDVTKDEHSQDDLIADMFINLSDKLALLENLSEKQRTSYIVTTSKNVAFNFIKRRHLERLLFLDDKDYGMLIAADYDMEGEYLYHETMDEIVAIVHKLPEFWQLLYKNKYQLDLSSKQIADLLNVQPSSVRMNLTRLRRMLKAAINKKEM